MALENRKIWLVEFPTYQYNENVKQLALQKGLKIVDSRHSELFSDDWIEKKPPNLTIRGSKLSKKKSTVVG